MKLFAAAPSKSPATVMFPLDIDSDVVEDNSNSPLTSKVAPEPEIVKSPSISAFPVHSISPSEIVIDPPLLWVIDAAVNLCPEFETTRVGPLETVKIPPTPWEPCTVLFPEPERVKLWYSTLSISCASPSS